jgi:ceramide glucosyltransferase
LSLAFAWLAGVFALLGVIQQVVGTFLIVRFVARPRPAPANLPPVSIIKPLCGVDPLTELALESFFLLDYPARQLIFGVQNGADPVLAIVERLRADYPAQDVTVVIDARLHGSNRKVSNMINMLHAASYETLVMSDADIHVPPHFLQSVVAALAEPGVGLVTTLYTGLPGTGHLATAMGTNHINYNFLPGALLARRLGRRDALGVTMAMTRQTLQDVGGLAAVANNLGDDQVLGRLVRARGLALTLAGVIPATTVPEADFRALFRHELRWARTIRALVPLPYATSVLQISLFWAAAAVVFSGGEWIAWELFFAVLIIRYALARRIDKALGLAKAGEPWLFLLRDVVSGIIFVASYCGDRVDWRGQTMQADHGKAGGTPAGQAGRTPVQQDAD